VTSAARATRVPRLDVAADDQVGADAVDRRRAERADQPEGDEEDPAVHRRLDPDVADSRGAAGEQRSLVVRPAEQLHQLRTGNVEPLGHLRVHLRVGVHLLTCQFLKSPADSLGRDDEQRQHDQCQQGEAPLQEHHRRERRDQHDDVADHAAERAGDCVLRADHIVVEAAGQGAGLSAREERDRHSLDLAEQGSAQVIDQALADARRAPSLNDRQGRVGDRGADDDRGEHGDQLSSFRDGVVEDRPERKRGDELEQCADEDGHQEQR
jgi:hypothetical protein